MGIQQGLTEHFRLESAEESGLKPLGAQTYGADVQPDVEELSLGQEHLMSIDSAGRRPYTEINNGSLGTSVQLDSFSDRLATVCAIGAWLKSKILSR